MSNNLNMEKIYFLLYQSSISLLSFPFTHECTLANQNVPSKCTTRNITMIDLDFLAVTRETCIFKMYFFFKHVKDIMPANYSTEGFLPPEFQVKGPSVCRGSRCDGGKLERSSGPPEPADLAWKAALWPLELDTNTHSYR